MHISPLSRKHERGDFSCGVAAIDNFFSKSASKQNANGLVRVHVATLGDSMKAVGFFSLCLKAYEPDLCEETQKVFGRVNSVPTVYLAMLGVDEKYKGNGIGKHLLADACSKALSIADIAGTYALTLNANTEGLCDYYSQIGFIRMGEDDPTRIMYLPIAHIRKAFEE